MWAKNKIKKKKKKKRKDKKIKPYPDRITSVSRTSPFLPARPADGWATLTAASPCLSGGWGLQQPSQCWCQKGRSLIFCYDTTMTAAYKSFPSLSCASVFSTASKRTKQIYSFNPPDPASHATTLALCLLSELDKTPDGDEFFRSSFIHLVKSPWGEKKKNFGKRMENLQGCWWQSV